LLAVLRIGSGGVLFARIVIGLGAGAVVVKVNSAAPISAHLVWILEHFISCVLVISHGAL
jgi:hypothetical protein